MQSQIHQSSRVALPGLAIVLIAWALVVGRPWCDVWVNLNPATDAGFLAESARAGGEHHPDHCADQLAAADWQATVLSWSEPLEQTAALPAAVFLALAPLLFPLGLVRAPPLRRSGAQRRPLYLLFGRLRIPPAS